MIFAFFLYGAPTGTSFLAATYNGNRVFFGERHYYNSYREVLRRATGRRHASVFKGFYSIDAVSSSVSFVSSPCTNGHVRYYEFSNTISASSHCGVTEVWIRIGSIRDAFFVSYANIGYFVGVFSFWRMSRCFTHPFLGWMSFVWKATEGRTAAATRGDFVWSSNVFDRDAGTVAE